MQSIQRVITTLAAAAMLALAGGAALGAKQAEVLDWEDLIPEDERDIEIPPPPGWGTGSLDGLDGLYSPVPVLPAGVVEELDGQRIKLPGFVVPLESDEGGNLTEFFLVPYFGACIHVPPPPPNQIVYVTLEEPFFLESMYQAYWITGIMKTENFSSGLGASAYTMAGDTVEVYEY